MLAAAPGAADEVNRTASASTDSPAAPVLATPAANELPKVNPFPANAPSAVYAGVKVSPLSLAPDTVQYHS